MNGEQRNRRAAVLLILAPAMWWVEWMPVFVTAFFLWMILHKRLEDDPGGALLRRSHKPQALPEAPPSTCREA